MKILHTSDWHIGKHLHKYDLAEDLGLFFDWLVPYIEDNGIDVLLVSGDVFDQANPSQAAFKQYYDVLRRLVPLDCKVIITGGNHDSPAALNAPKELLEAFDITVIGGAPASIGELFTPVHKNGETVQIAGVPFLKDRDIRTSVAGEDYSTKIAQLQAGLHRYFETVNDHYKHHGKQAFFIVMGHLYVQGGTLSDSERDIQIGNQAGVSTSMFQGIPDYVALGHIHKPQTLSKTGAIHYCGSPIPLSFSEKEDRKQVNLLTVTGNRLADVSFIALPKFRNLISFNGDLETVQKAVTSYADTTPLPSLAEINVTEEKESLERRQAFEGFINSDPNPRLHIVKSRLTFQDKIRGASDAFAVGTDVSDVTPMQMFEKKLELQSKVTNTEALKAAFKEVLEELKL